MARIKTKPRSATTQVSVNGTAPDVLTLREAASYLQLREESVLELVHEQGLPGRQIGTEWRFLKSAIQNWLNQPFAMRRASGIWAAAGSWEGDPFFDDLLKEVYRRRGRDMVEGR